MTGTNDASVLAGVLDDVDVLSRQLNLRNNLLDGVIGCVQLSDAIDYTGKNVHGGVLLFKAEVCRSVIETTILIIKNMKYRPSEAFIFPILS